MARDDLEAHGASGRRQATLYPGIRRPRRKTGLPAARNPGKPAGPHPRSSVLHRLGVRLISFDRPGYGGSDRLEGRRVADAAADVLAIADAYELEKFAVVGRSGGGPHALACAALLPERTTKTAVLVGLAPHGADGLDWFDGMAQSNVAGVHGGRERLRGHRRAHEGDRRRDPGQSGQPDRDPAGRAARPGPAGGRRPGYPVDTDRELRRGHADVGLRLDRRRAGVLLAMGLRSGRRQGARPALARRAAMSSPRPATPGGWPTRSPAPPWSFRQARPISARWTCFRTSSGGCPPAASGPRTVFAVGPG